MNTTPSTASPTTAPAPVLLSPAQLARHFGVSRRTVSHWTRDKLLPVIRIGAVLRFDLAKVQAALARFEQAAESSTIGTDTGSSISTCPPPQEPRPPLDRFVLTAAQLEDLPVKQIQRHNATRRAMWRHWYDPYAGPPVAQTVEEALARAATAAPGTVPEVEMLTDEEYRQRLEQIRARQQADRSAKSAAKSKR